MQSGTTICWNVLAELVNAARPEDWDDDPVDASLIRKNFTVRNEQLYQDIREDVAAYLAACAQLPEKERPTLIGWTLARRTAS